MRLIIFVFVLVSISAVSQDQQLGTPAHTSSDIEVLNRNYLLSKNFKDGDYLKSNGESSFAVKYTGFTPEAQAAFQYAVDIWDNLLKSEVTIRIFATWAVSSNPNNLGSASPVEIKDFENAPLTAVWYPMPLAEKLARKSLNNNAEADIVANFNSGRTDWYLGTDGNCPADKFDFVTVVLHEIGHGLGISGTFFVNEQQIGFYGRSGFPKIYDRFVQNSIGQNILSNFQNNTIELAGQLTGNSLVFSSEIAKKLEGISAFPRIYAPSPYNPGSSISHLDQTTYNGTPNGLMTPFASRAKVEHDPGQLVKGMLYDMGWLTTFLEHQSIGDQEDLTGKKFVLDVLTDTTLLNGSVKLIYSQDDFTSQDENVMIKEVNGYSSEINPLQEGTISYYFEVKDVLDRTFRLPTTNTEYFSFFYGADTQAPFINHTKLSDITEFQKELIFTTTVFDNIGLQRVYVEYSLNGGAAVEFDLTSQGNNSYSAVLNLEPLALMQGDQISYSIKAIDASSNSNVAVNPSVGTNLVNVKTFLPTALFISNLNSDKQDFFGDFQIITPTGFTNGAIHSPHPYSTGVALTYRLLHPIIIKAENSFFKFDEIVLVEPGTGTDFNQVSFKDYVVVEGSTDNGQNWIPLGSGYDSRDNQTWLTYYNSNIINGDSKAIGTQNFYFSRNIDLLDFFNENDVVIFRFRLSSDQMMTGWGWAIDNLSIQDNIVGLDDEVDELKGVIIAPNPTKGKFTILLKKNDSLNVKVMNIMGQTLLLTRKSEIDLSDYPSGIYFITVQTSLGVSVKRLIKN